MTESNINRVGKPNGEGKITAEGWSRSQLARLHTLHNDGQISQEGPDHRINFFYVHHTNNDEYSDNNDMYFRLEEEYKESLYNNYNENDRQCSYHDLYANRSITVTNSSTNNNHQYNINNDNTNKNNDDNFNNNNNYNNRSDGQYRNNSDNYNYNQYDNSDEQYRNYSNNYNSNQYTNSDEQYRNNDNNYNYNQYTNSDEQYRRNDNNCNSNQYNNDNERSTHNSDGRHKPATNNASNNEYNNNTDYHGWTREAINQLSDTDYTQTNHTCNVIRVEKRKYKSSPSPTYNDEAENIQNEDNNKVNEELDNQLDNYTSLRNAPPVTEIVELNNNSECNEKVIPVQIDNKNDNKDSDSNLRLALSHPLNQMIK